jgi:endonuclease-3
MSESLAEKKKRTGKILAILSETFPDAACTLDFKNPFQLLVATILAAQSTDKGVNLVTPGLFRKYPDAKSLASAAVADVEKIIKPTGFFHNKTKSLLGMSRALVERHAGKVPDDMDALTALPGVGRKTANVIRGAAFGKPAIIVDTHMRRVSGRLGLTDNTDPDKIEIDLQKLLPEDDWTRFSHTIVFHGRNICIARRPKCPDCPVVTLCPYPTKTPA